MSSFVHSNRKEPLTVMGVGFYINKNGKKKKFYHQMTLAGVENNEFIIQNTAGLDGLKRSETLIRISLNRKFYIEGDDNAYTCYVIDERGSDKKFKPENFYLWPYGYSITLKKLLSSSKEREDLQKDDRQKKEVEALLSHKNNEGQAGSNTNPLNSSSLTQKISRNKKEETKKEKQEEESKEQLTSIQEDNDEADHPHQLTKESVDNWLKVFYKQLQRTSSRNHLDRLILSIERTDFNNTDSAGWSEFIFENNVGKVHPESKWQATLLQKKILESNYDCRANFIPRSELKEETGSWQLNDSLKKKLISKGGEAIVIMEEIEGLEVVARVQVFDPLVFTKNEEIIYNIQLSKGKKNKQTHCLYFL